MKQKSNSTLSPMVRGLVLGTAMCFMITLIGAAVCAILISSEVLPADSMGYCALIILLLAAITGSAAGAEKVREKRLYICLLVGVIYMLSLLAVTALFFGGQYEGIGVTALLIFSGAIVTALLGLNRGKRPNLRKSKIKHR